MTIQTFSLKPKVIAAFLLVGLLPFSLVGLISLRNSGAALERSAFNQLESVRAIKKSQIERFFAEREGDMGVLMETVATLRREAFAKLTAVQAIKRNQIDQYFKRVQINLAILAKNPTTVGAIGDFEQAFKAEGGKTGGSQWTGVDRRIGHVFANLLKEDGYYDVFLIAADGDVVYSATREPDLGQNLIRGPLKDSGLAKAFRDSATQKVGFADLAPYAPSGNKPAGFLATSVVDASGKRIGAVAVQIPVNQINEIMGERTGLGKSGETFLVGGDKLMRSDSFLDRENRTVDASFAHPDKGRVDSVASRAALAGESGTAIITDYKGNAALAAYAPLEVYGVRWAMIAKIDAAEAFVPTDETGAEYYKKYVDLYGYYDLFLMNPDGYVFYTAAKESDYRTNMVDGKFAGSNLGKLVRSVLETKRYGFADFAPYAPSNDEPAAFIARPVVSGGKVEMVAAMQISLKAINDVMQQRDGMGKTGETYLVGSDRLMRSDSFLDVAGHSVKASFANPAKGSVDTVAARDALAGKTGAEIIIDYNGNPVLSAYAPVKIGDTMWALIAEIDEAEAFQATHDARMLMAIMGAVGALAIALAGYLLAGGIANPVVAMTRAMSRLAGGDLQVAIPARERGDEIGDMAKAVEVFKDNAIRVEHLKSEQEAVKRRAEEQHKAALNELAGSFEASVKGIVQIVSSSATELQSSAQSLSAVAEQTVRQSTAVAAASEQASVNVQTVASAADELAASISEISRQVNQSVKVSRGAVEQADHVNAMIQGLASAASKIGDVVKLINDIASQTNLLALNATIEAARAGDAGKGFAVVANEVKSLANQTARATDEISGQIAAVQSATATSVEAIKAITGTIGEISEIGNAIAAAVEEQGAATKEIARNVEQAAAGTAEVSSNIVGVNESSAETGRASEQVLDSARELSIQSEHLRDDVDRFIAHIRAG